MASTLQPNCVGLSEQSALAPVGICIFNFFDYWLTPTVLAHYLPRVVGGTAGPAEVSTTGPGQARVGPDRKHGNRGYINRHGGIHRNMLHVTTHLPSSLLESPSPGGSANLE